MKRTLVIVGVLAAGLAFAADAKKDSTKSDQEKFNGVWKAVSGVFEGKELPKEAIEKMSLTLKGSKFTLHNGPEKAEGTYKIDASKTPKTIDVTHGDGSDKDKLMLGIYELTDDTYKVCFAAPGEDRPTEFVSKPGSGTRLIVMKREKP